MRNKRDEEYQHILDLRTEAAKIDQLDEFDVEAERRRIQQESDLEDQERKDRYKRNLETQERNKTTRLLYQSPDEEQDIASAYEYQEQRLANRSKEERLQEFKQVREAEVEDLGEKYRKQADQDIANNLGYSPDITKSNIDTTIPADSFSLPQLNGVTAEQVWNDNPLSVSYIERQKAELAEEQILARVAGATLIEDPSKFSKKATDIGYPDKTYGELVAPLVGHTPFSTADAWQSFPKALLATSFYSRYGQSSPSDTLSPVLPFYFQPLLRARQQRNIPDGVDTIEESWFFDESLELRQHLQNRVKAMEEAGAEQQANIMRMVNGSLPINPDTLEQTGLLLEPELVRNIIRVRNAFTTMADFVRDKDASSVDKTVGLEYAHDMVVQAVTDQDGKVDEQAFSLFQAAYIQFMKDQAGNFADGFWDNMGKRYLSADIKFLKDGIQGMKDVFAGELSTRSVADYRVADLLRKGTQIAEEIPEDTNWFYKACFIAAESAPQTLGFMVGPAGMAFSYTGSLDRAYASAIGEGLGRDAAFNQAFKDATIETAIEILPLPGAQSVGGSFSKTLSRIGKNQGAIGRSVIGRSALKAADYLAKPGIGSTIKTAISETAAGTFEEMIAEPIAGAAMNVVWSTLYNVLDVNYGEKQDFTQASAWQKLWSEDFAEQWSDPAAWFSTALTSAALTGINMHKIKLSQAQMRDWMRANLAGKQSILSLGFTDEQAEIILNLPEDQREEQARIFLQGNLAQDPTGTEQRILQNQGAGVFIPESLRKDGSIAQFFGAEPSLDNNVRDAMQAAIDLAMENAPADIKFEYVGRKDNRDIYRITDIDKATGKSSVQELTQDKAEAYVRLRLAEIAVEQARNNQMTVYEDASHVAQQLTGTALGKTLEAEGKNIGIVTKDLAKDHTPFGEAARNKGAVTTADIDKAAVTMAGTRLGKWFKAYQKAWQERIRIAEAQGINTDGAGFAATTSQHPTAMFNRNGRTVAGALLLYVKGSATALDLMEDSLESLIKMHVATRAQEIEEGNSAMTPQEALESAWSELADQVRAVRNEVKRRQPALKVPDVPQGASRMQIVEAMSAMGRARLMTSNAIPSWMQSIQDLTNEALMVTAEATKLGETVKTIFKETGNNPLEKIFSQMDIDLGSVFSSARIDSDVISAVRTARANIKAYVASMTPAQTPSTPQAPATTQPSQAPTPNPTTPPEATTADSTTPPQATTEQPQPQSPFAPLFPDSSSTTTTGDTTTVIYAPSIEELQDQQEQDDLEDQTDEALSDGGGDDNQAANQEQPSTSQEQAATQQDKQETQRIQDLATADAQVSPSMQGVFTNNKALYNHGAKCWIGFVPIFSLALSPDVQQVKAGSTRKNGVINELTGDYQHDTAPIFVWKRKDGKLEVISGRHRFELAQRNGVENIACYVYEESDIHDAKWARLLDYENNMRDDQADELTAASYVRETQYDDETLRAKGLLRKNSKSRRGITIGRYAKDELWTQFKNGVISAKDAELICLATKDLNPAKIEAIQRQCCGFLADGRSWDYINTMIQCMLVQEAEASQGLLDLGIDFTKSMERIGTWVEAGKKQLTSAINTIKAGSKLTGKQKAMADRLGITASTAQDIKNKINALTLIKEKLDHIATFPDLLHMAATWDEYSPIDMIDIALNQGVQEVQELEDEKNLSREDWELAQHRKNAQNDTLTGDLFSSNQNGALDGDLFQEEKELQTGLAITAQAEQLAQERVEAEIAAEQQDDTTGDLFSHGQNEIEAEQQEQQQEQAEAQTEEQAEEQEQASPQAKPKAKGKKAKKEAPQKNESASDSSSTLEDAGRKIKANKDKYEAHIRPLEAEMPDDPGKVTVSKYFPVPDWKKLVNEGVTQDTIVAMALIRSLCPDKPKGRKLRYFGNQWLTSLKEYRRMTAELLAGTVRPDEVLASARTISKFAMEKVSLMEALGYPYCLKAMDLCIEKHTFVGEDYKTTYTAYTVERTRKKGELPESVAGKEYETREEATKALRAALVAEAALEEKAEKDAKKKHVKLSISYYTAGERAGEYLITRDLPGGVRIRLKEGLSSAEEAQQYMDEHMDELQEKLRKATKTPETLLEVSSERVGEDYRAGKNVDNAMFMEAFGVNGITYGNWVNGPERQAKLNATYDAFMDLAHLLGIPPRVISLNGSLGIQFGASGKGGNNAHYRLNDISINLTRNNGHGALAHEWWHALDNYFMRAHADQPLEMASNKTHGYGRNRVMNERAGKAFTNLMVALINSDYRSRSKRMNNSAYWSSNIEMSARAFEAYIIKKAQEAGITNDFLSTHISHELFAEQDEAYIEATGEDRYPFPIDEEMEEFSPLFDEFFKSLTHTEQEDGNFVTFSLTIPQTRICHNRAEARAMIDRKGEPIHLENKFLNVEAVFSKMSERKFAHANSRKRSVDNLVKEGIPKEEANALHWTAYGNIKELFSNGERMKFERAYKKNESRKGFLHVYSPFDVKGHHGDFEADIELMLLKEKGSLPTAYILNVGVQKKSQLIPSIPAAKSSPKGDKSLFVATDNIKETFPEIVKPSQDSDITFSLTIPDHLQTKQGRAAEANRLEDLRTKYGEPLSSNELKTSFDFYDQPIYDRLLEEEKERLAEEFIDEQKERLAKQAYQLEIEKATQVKKIYYWKGRFIPEEEFLAIADDKKKKTKRPAYEEFYRDGKEILLKKYEQYTDEEIAEAKKHLRQKGFDEEKFIESNINEGELIEAAIEETKEAWQQARLDWIYDTWKLITAEIEALGYLIIKTSSSNISDSKYIYVSKANAQEAVKVRLSDHQDKYGSDIDIRFGDVHEMIQEVVSELKEADFGEEESSEQSFSLTTFNQWAQVAMSPRPQDVEAQAILKRLNFWINNYKRITSNRSNQDGSALFGAFTSILEATKTVLPPKYKLGKINMLLNWAAVYAEMVNHGGLPAQTGFINSNPISQNFIKKLEKIREDNNLFPEEAIRDYGRDKLDDMFQRVVYHISGKLDEFIKDRHKEQIYSIYNKLLPGKTAKGAPKKGKLDADAYRKLQFMIKCMNMDSAQADSLVASYNQELADPNITQEREAQLQDKIAIVYTYGVWSHMSSIESERALVEFKKFVLTGKNTWQAVLAKRKARTDFIKKDISSRITTDYDAITRTSESHRPDTAKAGAGSIYSIMNFVQLLNAAEKVLGTPFVNAMSTRVNDAIANIKLARIQKTNAFFNAVTQATGLTKEYDVTNWLNKFSKVEKHTGILLRQPIRTRHKVSRAEAERWTDKNIFPDKASRDAERDKLRNQERTTGEAVYIPTEQDIIDMQDSLLAHPEAQDITIHRLEYKPAKELVASRDAVANAILLFEQEDYKHLIANEGIQLKDMAGKNIPMEDIQKLDLEQTLKPLYDFIGKDGREFIYKLREEVNRNGKVMQQAFEDRTGVPLAMKDNYWKGNFDLGIATQQDDNSQPGQPHSSPKGSPTPSFLIERVVHHNEPIKWDNTATSIFNLSIEAQNNYTYIRPITEQWHDMLRDRNFERKLTVEMGQPWIAAMQDSLNIFDNVLDIEARSTKWLRKIMANMRSALAVTALGGNFFVLAKQASAILNALVGGKIPTQHLDTMGGQLATRNITILDYLQGMIHVVTGKSKLSFQDLTTSKYWQARHRTPHELIDKRITADDGANVTTWQSAVSRFSMSLIEKTDTAFNLPGMLALGDQVYRHAEKINNQQQLGLTPDQLKEIALNFVGNALGFAAQPQSKEEKSISAGKGGILASSFLLFKSETLNKLAATLSSVKAGHGFNATQSLLMYGTLNAGIAAIISYIKNGDDDEERRKKAHKKDPSIPESKYEDPRFYLAAFWKIATSEMSTMPFVGEVFQDVGRMIGDEPTYYNGDKGVFKKYIDYANAPRYIQRIVAGKKGKKNKKGQYTQECTWKDYAIATQGLTKLIANTAGGLNPGASWSELLLTASTLANWTRAEADIQNRIQEETKEEKTKTK